MTRQAAVDRVIVESVGYGRSRCFQYDQVERRLRGKSVDERENSHHPEVVGKGIEWRTWRGRAGRDLDSEVVVSES